GVSALLTTVDHLLNGRVAYAQPAEGFRTGIEPVLLAATVPARPGERVMEGGSGAGAGLLCLSARVAGVQGVGIERDPGLVELATANAAGNNASGLSFVAADLAEKPDCGRFDHAFANPPYHPARGTVSPDPARALAKQAAPGLLEIWVRSMAAPLRHHGTLTFVLPAGSLPECLAAMAVAGCPGAALLPLWPRSGQPAKLLLVRGSKGGRMPLRLLPGLVLHGPDGCYTAAATAILRDGSALPMG
ncbi:MAG TPA: methyltransferase, partial [Acetobacteraceae bacterium]|nr:methyltransferase [Acetobacteraceae bacterium]